LQSARHPGAVSSLDSFVRDSKDALIGEHRKASAEWDKIQESFVKWVGSGVAAAATTFMTGHIVPDAAALSGATLNALSQLALRHMRKAQFRKSNPMSVFIDLSEKEITRFLKANAAGGTWTPDNTAKERRFKHSDGKAEATYGNVNGRPGLTVRELRAKP